MLALVNEFPMRARVLLKYTQGKFIKKKSSDCSHSISVAGGALSYFVQLKMEEQNNSSALTTISAHHNRIRITKQSRSFPHDMVASAHCAENSVSCTGK